MIFTSALCFVLALTLISAKDVSKAEVDKLVDQISSEVAKEMAKVANAVHKDPKTSTLGLHYQLLETLRDQLKKMKSKIKELDTLTKNSNELISKKLADKINDNETLKKALDVDEKQKPRFIGALIIGITQIVTDVTNMILRRY